MNEFPTLLAAYRERLGISRNKLAKKVGVDPGYLTRIEHGYREPPRVGIVTALARGLGLNSYEQDKLLLSSGYAPQVINGSGWSPALHAVSEVLNNRALSESDRARFEQFIVGLAGVMEVIAADQPVQR